jgi:membrane protease YdiL (CAAX protease family)
MMSQRHSIFGVNVLFLIVLVLQSANFFLFAIPQYLRLILNEAFFVLLPSLLYLRWAGLPWRQTLRLNNPGWRTALASLALGVGLYPASVMVGALIQTLLGYQLLDAEALLPQTPGEAVLAILAYAIMAPLCEEIFARGIIQRTYEHQFSPGRAMLFSGAMFIVFHLSLLQGLTIIPLTLALSYVYWRSRSLAASILTHLGANAMAALVVTSGVFWKQAPQILLSPFSAALGLLLAGAGLRALKKDTSPAKGRPESLNPKQFRQFWPLLAAAALYLVVMGLEFSTTRLSEGFHDPIQVGAAPWDRAVSWSHIIRNRLDDPIGEGTGHLQPEEEKIILSWSSEQKAYDIQTDGGRFLGSEHIKTIEATWRQKDGTPLQGTATFQFDHGSSETIWSFDGLTFLVHYREAAQPVQTFEVPLEEGVETLILEDSSWPWVLSSLPFAPGYRGSAYLFAPYTWRHETGDNGPLFEPVTVRVTGPESLETPAGSTPAWKVTINRGKTAWYTAEVPHTLLQYDNTIETVVLQMSGKSD